MASSTSETDYIYFYHYTCSTDKDEIIECGYIREGYFDHFGTGVYGTTMSPIFGKTAIAKNNWRGGWRNRLECGRADYAIRVRLPKSKVTRCMDGRRDIYKYAGQLTLSEYEWTVMEV